MDALWLAKLGAGNVHLPFIRFAVMQGCVEPRSVWVPRRLACHSSIGVNNELSCHDITRIADKKRSCIEHNSFLVYHCVVGEGFNDRSPCAPLRSVPESLENSLPLSLLARSRGATLPPPPPPNCLLSTSTTMSFIPYGSVNPEDECLPPLYFRPIPQRNLEAANIAHLPSAYVKDELRALRHRCVLFSLIPN